MASVSPRRTRRQGSYAPVRPRAYQPPKRRWPKRVVISLTLLVIAVLVLPTVVAKTPLRDAPLRLALQNLHGTIQAGGASLSWFARWNIPTFKSATNVATCSSRSAKVESERSLFGLLSNLNDLGTFRVEQPQVNVALRPDGSDLEDLFAKPKSPFEKTESVAAQPAAKESKRLPALTAEIIDGSVNVLDTTSGKKWQINKFNLHVRTTSDTLLPAELMASAEVPLDGHSSQVAINSVPNQTGGWDHIDAKIDSLPLALFRGLADRVAPGLELSGTLSTNLRLDGIVDNLAPALAQGTAQATPIQISGTASLDKFVASGGPLGTDRLALDRVDLPCKLAYRGHQIDIGQLGITSDIGQLNIAGSIAANRSISTQYQHSASLFRIERRWPNRLGQACRTITGHTARPHRHADYLRPVAALAGKQIGPQRASLERPVIGQRFGRQLRRTPFSLGSTHQFTIGGCAIRRATIPSIHSVARPAFCRFQDTARSISFKPRDNAISIA